MNKSELVSDVAARADLTKEQASAAVEGMLEAITNAMKNGDEVRLIGFGTFLSQHRPERMGRNPQTGAEQKIAAANVPKFKPGKPLKDALNG